MGLFALPACEPEGFGITINWQIQKAGAAASCTEAGGAIVDIELTDVSDDRAGRIIQDRCDCIDMSSSYVLQGKNWSGRIKLRDADDIAIAGCDAVFRSDASADNEVTCLFELP